MTVTDPAAPVEPGATGTATPDSTEEISRWVSAAADTRSTAKWVIMSLAAIAGVVFGAGPIVSRPELSWTDDRTQLLVALVLGAAGLVAIVLLIGRIALVLAPTRVTLLTLPQAMRAELDAAPDQLLPTDARTYDEFLQRLRLYEALAVRLPGEVRKLEAGLAGLHPNSNEHRRLSGAAAGLRTNAEVAEQNRELYRATAQRYLQRAEYKVVSDIFTRGRRGTVALAIVAALGGLGFQLALASNGSADEPAGSAAPGARLAHLVRVADRDGGLWEALRLDRCANPDGEVPVLLTGGNGTPDDPWSVTTVQTRTDCPAQSFNVIDDAIVLRTPTPEAIAVTYVPAPTTSR